MAKNSPIEPTVNSDFNETKKYLDHLKDSRRPVSIRTLISYWGYKSRGSRAVDSINRNIAQMGLSVDPPLDSGPLDTLVALNRITPEDARLASAEQPDEHLLTVSRIPSAGHVLRAPHEENERGYVTKFRPAGDALTLMARHNYSQLPVINDEDTRTVAGVFTWESFGLSRLRGGNPRTVGDATTSSSVVDLHADLFSCVADIADNGHVIVTYRGRLAGLVTASDLVLELEDMTLPFLAVGRCERELKRVAKFALAAPLAEETKSLDDMTFGNLQYLYRDNWDSLGWSLSRDEFIGWLNSTRELRNRVAHFDDQDQDYSSQIGEVHRLTRWLSSVRENAGE